MLRGGCFTIQALGSHGPWRDTKSLHKGEVLSAQYFQLPSGEYFLLKSLKILKQPLPVSPSGLTVSLGSQLLALWLICEKKEDVRTHQKTEVQEPQKEPQRGRESSPCRVENTKAGKVITIPVDQFAKYMPNRTEEQLTDEGTR